MSNSATWTALAILTYAVLKLCISTLATRWNRAHQWWKVEDEIDTRDKAE